MALSPHAGKQYVITFHIDNTITIEIGNSVDWRFSH